MLFFKQWPVSYNTPYEKIGDEVRSLADEVPFDIPDSWEWVRLGNISSYAETKQKVNATSADPSIWGLDLEDIEKGGRLLEHKTVGERKAVGDKTVFVKGDILYSKLRPYLLKILVAPDDGICTPEIVPFRIYGGINPNYIVNYLKSPYVDNLINSITYGVKMPRVGTETMTSLLVPIPPLEEQLRIVEKIDEVASAVSAYDVAYQKTEALNSTFPEALKKSILQEAVQGKLVPQDPSDEPAEALLECIRAEKQRLIKEGKIKKDKHESVIFRRDNSHYEQCGLDMVCIDDQLPFQIPDTWQWERLINIYNFIDYRGATPNKTAKGVPLITAKNVKKGFIDYTVSEFISENEYQNRQSRGVSQEGDILFTTEAPMGNAALANLPIYSAGQRLITFQQYGVHKGLSNELMLYFILSDSFQRQLSDQSTGTTVKGIKAEKLKQLYIPVPPEDEQQRIIHAIRAAFRLVTAL
mgnify:FL=1